MGFLDRIQDLLSRLSAYELWEVAVELVIIWIVIYAIIRFLQGTRAARAIKGLIFVLIVGTLVVRVLGDDTLGRVTWLYDRVLAGFALALVVIFQPEQLSEQLQLIQCAFAFIAVQGAGAAWYRFLPDNAIFVELYYRGWVSKYKRRAQISRPDIKTEAVYCTAVTPDRTWIKYAQQWLDLKSKDITDIDITMKEKLIAKSAQVDPIRGNIWKDSDVVCPPELIVSALSTNLKLLDPSHAAALVVNPAM